MNKFSMLMHCSIMTFSINVNILKNSEKEEYTIERRNRGRNIIWYNPPFSKNVTLTQFLHLLDKHFSRNHKYHKVFNCHHVKINYSCMDNMTNIISGHNRRVTNSDNETDGKTFNFRNKNNCPLKKNV